jgi:hypothetical protein
MTYRIIALIAFASLLLLGTLAFALRVVGVERYTGYFAPVWDGPGNGIYFVQRQTSGMIWGMGWEHFSPPASTYVTSDEFSLQHLDTVTGKVEVLQNWSGSPLVNRLTKHYRGRIFNGLWARIDPSDGAVDFVLKMNIPRVPSSEIWFLSGSWRRSVPADVKWSQDWRNHAGVNDRVLTNNIEIMAIPGPESFPAAIVAIDADGENRVLINSSHFDAHYPDGIPKNRIAERSHRHLIERSRTLRQTQSELMAKHEAAGLSKGEAMLQASEDLEELGLLPKRPRLVAQRLDNIPPGVRVFDIPQDYFEVGLFTDIAAAIARPGTLVDTSTGTYLKYYDDEVGPKLKAWRQAGNEKFVVRSEDKLFKLTVRRFKNKTQSD